MDDPKQFRNVPAHLQAKMESCVQQVKKRDPELSKSRAIAICFASVVEGKSYHDLLTMLPDLAAYTKAQPQELRSLLEGKIHEAFTVAADQLLQRGYLDRDSRIALSRLIGDTLGTFGAAIDPDIAAVEVEEQDTEAIADKEAPMKEDLADVKHPPQNGPDPGGSEKLGPMAVAHESEMPLPLGGASSWDELDTWKDTQQLEDHVRMTTNAFELMIRNIFKKAAIGEIDNVGAAIAALANGFTPRVEAGPESKDADPKAPTVTVRYDEPTFEPKEDPPTGIRGFLDRWWPAARESLDDKQNGAPTKKVDGVSLRAGDFASVGNTREPGTWKLPLTKSPGGDPDFGRVSAAIQAISSAGFRGQRAQLTAPRARVVSRISGAISRGNFSDEQKSRLWERLNAVKAIAESALVVTKDQRGEYWAIGFVTNNYRDRDIAAAPKAGGEILTTESHREFMAWLDANPKMAPHLWPWHTSIFAGRELPTKSQAAWWDFMEPEGFVVMAWPLTEKEAAAISRAEAKYGPLGMSHGFISAERFRDRDRGLVHRYRMFEGSYLPQDKAANLWTPIETLQKEASMPITDTKKPFLEAVIGDDKVTETEEGAKARAAALQAAHVEQKDNLPADPSEPAPDDTAQDTDPTPDPEPAPDPKSAEGQMAALAKVLAAELGLKDLDTFLKGMSGDLTELKESVQVNATAIEKIAGQVTALEKSDDEKIAQKLTPQADPDSPIWKQAASQSDDNVIEDDKDAPPGPGIEPTEEGAWVRKVHPGAVQAAPAAQVFPTD